MKEKIAAQSFDGTFFIENAVRKDGRLSLTNNLTETCQYYAFYFGIADTAQYTALFKLLQTAFGPRRDVAACYPNVYPSNAFVGNYFRIELLIRKGLYEQALTECKEYFYKQAVTTGSLWEHDKIGVGVSLTHGFASAAAIYISDILKVLDPDSAASLKTF